MHLESSHQAAVDPRRRANGAVQEFHVHLRVTFLVD
jgi:hypothetical protein